MCFTLFCIGLYIWSFYADRSKLQKLRITASKDDKFRKKDLVPNVSEESKTGNYIEEISGSDDNPDCIANTYEINEENMDGEDKQNKNHRKIKFQRDNTESEGNFYKSKPDLMSQISDSTLSNVYLNIYIYIDG